MVAESVDSEVGDEISRRDLVETRLAHLLATDEQPAVREHMPRRFEPGGHQHRGPVHRVEAQDVLADEVVVGGPPLGEARVVGRVPDRGAVVEERVGPHVRDVLRVPGQRNTPVDRRPAHREVLQTTADESEDFVHARLRLHRVGMRGVVLEEPVGEARQAEEVVLLDHELDRAEVDRAVTVDQLVLGVVRLARDAVEAFVRSELDVTLVVDRLQEFLHRDVVTRLGRADEVVVGDVERIPRRAEVGGGLVDELLGRHTSRLRGALHLEAVLVGAGEKEDLVAAEASPARQRVAGNRRVRVTDVRHVVDVIDGCRDVEASHGGFHSA